MVFVLDIGNTHIVAGVYKDGKLAHHWRISTDRKKTEDEYGLIFVAMLAHAGVSLGSFTGAAIASVVPPLTPILEKAVRQYVGPSPIVVGPGTKTGMNIKYENPKEVGPDRIVNAVAAYQKYGGPVIVVDFGTATTLDVVSADGEYLGGAIAPGILTATDALFEKASRLPRIEIARPQSAIGRNTVQSMQSGIVFGFAGQVDGLVTRVSEELRTEPYVVATGGLAGLVAAESRTIKTVDPWLTLDGLYIIYQRNSGTVHSPSPKG